MTMELIYNGEWTERDGLHGRTLTVGPYSARVRAHTLSSLEWEAWHKGAAIGFGIVGIDPDGIDDAEDKAVVAAQTTIIELAATLGAQVRIWGKVEGHMASRVEGHVRGRMLPTLEEMDK